MFEANANKHAEADADKHAEAGKHAEVDADKHDEYSIMGFIIYVIIFIVLIPYIFIRYKRYDILAAYFPNLDNIATALGYMGGPPILMPGTLWKYLRESCDESLFEFISVNFIHYISLLGLTFTVAYYTNKYKSVSTGMAIATFMLFITYILPGHVIQSIQDELGTMLNPYIPRDTLLHYSSITFVGLLIVYMFISFEEKMIHKFSTDLAKLIRYILSLLYIGVN
jgi:hypothetical protein